MTDLLSPNLWIIAQKRELSEIVLGFESSNKYQILSEDGKALGFIAEKSSGFFSWLKRQFLKKHRPFEASLFNEQGQVVLNLRRPFYWIWSSLFVEDGNGKLLGVVHRRFFFQPELRFARGQ